MTNEQLKIRTQQTIDAIPVLREKEYGWAEIEKMLNEILLELGESDWHTGIPTENGYYLVHMTIYDEEYELCVDFKDGTWDDRKWGFGYNYKILAYQKIEPFKED